MPVPRISKCNTVKAKYIILIIHVPHYFQQCKSLYTLNSISPPQPISLQLATIMISEIPPESRDRSFLTCVGNDSNPTLSVKDSSHRYLFTILYLIVRYPWMTAVARCHLWPPWPSSISPIVQGQHEVFISLTVRIAFSSGKQFYLPWSYVFLVNILMSL